MLCCAPADSTCNADVVEAGGTRTAEETMHPKVDVGVPAATGAFEIAVEKANDKLGLDVDATPAGLQATGAFEIAVEKGTDELGLDVDATSAGLQVLRVLTSGAVERHNASAPADQQLLALTFITAVNGATSNTSMINLMKTESTIRLTLARFIEYTAKVSKVDKACGLNLAFQKGTSVCVEIKGVLPGSVEDYNRGAPQAAQVQAGDFIVSANAACGTAKKIVEELKSARVLELKCLRGVHAGAADDGRGSSAPMPQVVQEVHAGAADGGRGSSAPMPQVMQEVAGTPIRVADVGWAPTGTGYPRVAHAGEPAEDPTWAAFMACCCCCWCLGIVAIMKAQEVTRANEARDYPLAHQKRREALMWIRVTIVVGILLSIIIIMFQLLGS